MKCVTVQWVPIALLSIFSLAVGVARNTQTEYASPEELALAPDGRLLYVTCSDSNEVAFVDTYANRVVARVRVGRKPRGIAIDPQAGRIYVYELLGRHCQ